MKKIYLLTLLSFLTTFAVAQVPVITQFAGPASVCSSPSGGSTYAVSATNAPTNYLWTVSPASGVGISGNGSSSVMISFPYSNGNYTISCVASNGSGSSVPYTYTVNVFETPTVTFSGANTFCQGSSTALQASSTILGGSSTIFYNWSPPSGLNTTSGANVLASPSVPTTYTVTGTIGNCSNNSTITITPMVSPVISVNPQSVSVCSGKSATLNASGANSYAWSNGITNGVGFVPTNSAVYSVVGTATNGCTGNASVNVTVNQNPGLNATASPGSICAGSSSTLSIAGNAATYSVNSVASGNSVILTPTASANYTVSGASTQGCVTTTTLTVFVSSCVGIKENISEATSLLVYPNPSNGTFTLRTEGNETAVITNELGQVIKTIRLEGGKEEQVSGLNNGIYFVITPSTKNRIVVIY